MGNDNIVHIAAVGTTHSWAARLKTQLRAAKSKTIRSRFEDTDQPGSDLWNSTWQVSTTLALCNLAVAQVKTATQEILKELHERGEDEIVEAMSKSACLPMRRPERSSLAALLSVDSFLFQHQSAVEKLENFLGLFWNEIFDEGYDREHLKPTLRAWRAKIDWIAKLKARRAKHFHEATPWIAIRIASTKPLQGGIVLLDERDNPTDVDLLDEIANEFLKTSRATITYVENQVQFHDNALFVRERLING